MTAADREMLARVRRAAVEVERFFRRCQFEADAAAERQRAERGLRHAIGLRKVVNSVHVPDVRTE